MTSARLLRRRLNRIENRDTRDERHLTTSRVFYTGKTLAGPRIDGDTALTIAAVFACIRFLTQSVASLPWDVRKPTKNNRASEPMPLHFVQKVLDRPSADYSTMQFREVMLGWALRRGNAYAEIERDVIGRPIGLHPIHPERVEVFRDLDSFDLFYKVDNGQDGSAILERRDMFHIRGFGDGPVGLDVMSYAAESLGWAKAAQLFGASFFGSGATPSGVVTMKRPLKPEGLLALEKRFQKLYGGPRNQNKTAFLDNEMDFKAIGIEPEKGQFIETNQHLVDEVCRWFGVPPHKIYHLLRATFSNIEHQSIEVVQDSLVPWAKRFELEANYKLLWGENRQKLFTKINFNALLRGDTKTRLEYYRGLREIGVLHADEIRELEDIAPIGVAGGGEKRVMQGQYTTLEKIGEDPEPAPEPTDPPGTEPAPDQQPAPDEATPGEGDTAAGTNALVRWRMNMEAAKSITAEREKVACPV